MNNESLRLKRLRRRDVSEPARTLAAAAVTLASAVVLSKVRDGWIDLGDGLLLVGAMAALARGVIRLASEPDDPSP
jgi:hypothetical protein